MARRSRYGDVRVRPDAADTNFASKRSRLPAWASCTCSTNAYARKFETEGLFEPSRKRAVPELPRRVALVSARGLGAEDFLAAIKRTTPFVEVIFVETRVEGLGADVEIASALDEASRTEVDAIVLARGGGSEKDLFVFNLEPVVRAIVRAKGPCSPRSGTLPIITFATKSPTWRSARHRWQPSTSQKAWLVASRRLSVAIRDLARSARDIVLRASQRCESGSGAVERATLRILAAKLADLAGRTARLERRNPQRTLADVRARLAASSGRLDTAAARLVSRKAHASGERGAALERGITALRTSFVRRLERDPSRARPLRPARAARSRVRNRHQGWARRARRRANSHRRLGRGAPGARDARSPRGTVSDDG